MPDFYNRTRGPLCITLGNGRSVTVKPKAWVSLSGEDMSSARLTEHLQSGNLLPSSLPPESAPVPTMPPLVIEASKAIPEAEAPKAVFIPATPPLPRTEAIPTPQTFRKQKK